MKKHLLVFLLLLVPGFSWGEPVAQAQFTEVGGEGFGEEEEEAEEASPTQGPLASKSEVVFLQTHESFLKEVQDLENLNEEKKAVIDATDPKKLETYKFSELDQLQQKIIALKTKTEDVRKDLEGQPNQFLLLVSPPTGFTPASDSALILNSPVLNFRHQFENAMNKADTLHAQFEVLRSAIKTKEALFGFQENVQQETDDFDKALGKQVRELEGKTPENESEADTLENEAEILQATLDDSKPPDLTTGKHSETIARLIESLKTENAGPGILVKPDFESLESQLEQTKSLAQELNEKPEKFKLRLDKVIARASALDAEVLKLAKKLKTLEEAMGLEIQFKDSAQTEIDTYTIPASGETKLAKQKLVEQVKTLREKINQTNLQTKQEILEAIQTEVDQAQKLFDKHEVSLLEIKESLKAKQKEIEEKMDDLRKKFPATSNPAQKDMNPLMISLAEVKVLLARIGFLEEFLSYNASIPLKKMTSELTVRKRIVVEKEEETAYKEYLSQLREDEKGEVFGIIPDTVRPVGAPCEGDVGCKIRDGRVKLSDIPVVLVHLIDLFTKLAGTLTVIMLLLAGWFYIISGLTEDKEKAKNMLKYALIGLIVTMLAWVIVNVIQVQLTA